MTWRDDEFDGRPELSKKRAAVLLIEGFVGFVVISLIVVGIAILVVDAQIGREDRDRLVDCTTPEGKCFQEGQKRTTELIGLLIGDAQNREDITRAVIIAAVACARDPENKTYKQMETCVNELIKE